MKTKLTKTDEKDWLQLEVIEEPTISPETIQKIKNDLDNLDDMDLEDDEKEKLREKKKKSGYDRITKGLLFIECLDKLKEEISKVDKSKEKTKFEEYLIKVDSKKLRNLIEDYNKGYSTYFTGEKIKDIVDENSEDIEQIINLFFKFFGDED